VLLLRESPSGMIPFLLRKQSLIKK
jgi:hypothetical protein